VASSYNLPSTVAALSLEFWFNTMGVAVSGSTRPLSLGNPGSSNKGIEFISATSPTVFQFVGGNGSTNTHPSPIYDVPPSGWHHYVGTFGSGTLTQYQDGVSVGTASLTGPITQDNGSGVDLCAGALAAGGYFNYATGLIAQVAFYTTALSAARVAAHYQAGAYA
jgi:hypothetical protein